MKKISLILISLLFITSCAGNWAKQNKTINFLPEIVQELNDSKNLPMKVSEKHKNLLLDSLGGPVKKDFTSNDLLEDIWVSWGEYPNTITFVRYVKDKNRNSNITYDRHGKVFSAGGGDNAHLPWITK